jgi:hypothetical protein
MRNMSLVAVLSLTAALSAQSPLTTLFASNNSNSAGGTVIFNLTVNTALTITQIDVNAGLGLAGGIAGTLEVRTCPTTYIGNELNAGAWTTVSTGNPLTTAASNTPTTCPLTTPIVLAPGTYGMMFKADTWQHGYTNGASPSPGNIFSNAELTIGAGAAQNVQFTAPFTPRVVNCNIHYTAAPGFATKSKYGDACYVTAGTKREFFAAAGAFDLSNSSMSLLYNGSNGYVAVPGVSAYQAPTGAAVSLALGDDTETAVALAGALPVPGGSTASLTVCSNGFVSVASGNGTAFTPSDAAWLAFSQTNWSGWHDYNPSAVGSGTVKFEQPGTLSIVTWDGVFDFGGTTPSTWQIQFDRSTGNVHFVWQAMSLLGNGHLVGFKCGGPVAATPAIDISAALPGTFPVGCDTLPIDLDASARPITGTSINLNTTRVPASASFSALLLNFAAVIPQLELSGLGMPGCYQHIGLAGATTLGLGFSTSWSQNLTIPNVAAYVGMNLFGQSAAFVPGANPLGVTSSNGLHLVVGNN